MGYGHRLAAGPGPLSRRVTRARVPVGWAQNAGLERADENTPYRENAALGKVEVGHMSLLVEGANRSQILALDDRVALGDVPDAQRIGIEVLTV